MIYLDNSATTFPKPKNIINAVDRALRMYSANPGRGGHKLSLSTAQAVFNARSKIKDFFKLNNEEQVIFTSGCTMSLNMVLKGVLHRGDHVIISSMEHNSVLRPLEKLREKGIVDYSIADIHPEDHDATVESFRQAINERTRMIVCTHASNVFGVRLPVERICALAHSYHILFCLDAAQSAGVLDINISDANYDFVCCAGHKGLYGPMGVGLLLVNSDIPLETLLEGGTGSESYDGNMPTYYPDRLESGTLNVPGIAGVAAGIDFVNNIGIENIANKEMQHIQFLYDRLTGFENIRLFTPRPDINGYVPVLSFAVDGTSSENVSRYLDAQYQIATRAGLHCAPLAHKHFDTIDNGTVRIAPSYFTTRSDIQILVNAVKNFRLSP